MIHQTKTLLEERHVSRAAIIDDAFDLEPTPGDIDSGKWDRFFDDVEDEVEASLRATYGAAAYDAADVTELRHDPRFVAIAWTHRASSQAMSELFADFEQLQEHKRSDLLPLQALLDELGVTYQLLGREDSSKVADAQIIFLDLFLGPDASGSDGEESVRTSMQRVRGIVAERRSAPPTVILMSANPRVQELGCQLRDDAELLGCEFRIVRKADLTAKAAMAERIYDLVLTYPDALKLNQFILAWDEALKQARVKFLRTIRTLDLADYANLQALTLDAEHARIGDYVVDLYDLHLHSVVESDEPLIRSAKALNDIAGGPRAPGQFMPSAEVVSMMDGAMFHHETRTRVDVDGANPGDVRLGDVLFVPPVASTTAAGTAVPAHVTEEGREVYVVISQACDQQHGDVDRVVLLRGLAFPYSWRQHRKAKTTRPRTPVMILGESWYTIEWNLLQPETWLLPELSRRLTEDGFRVIRRFRTPFALALQQGFTGRLSRVGTLAAPPARFAAGVKIYVKTRAGQALLVKEAAATEDQAVCLVGRTEEDLKEWLLLSDTFHADFRAKLTEIDSGTLPPAVTAAREDPAFYRSLKLGIEFARGNSLRPLKDTPFDIVQVFTSSRVVPGEPWPQGSKQPIIVEVFAE